MREIKFKNIVMLLLALAFMGGVAPKAVAQELSPEEAYSLASYMVAQNDDDKDERREYDTLRWRHNLRITFGTPSAIQTFFLDGIMSESNEINAPSRIPTASDKLADYRYYTTPTIMVTPISVEYNYYVKKWLTVGGRATFTALYNEVRNISTNEKLYSNGSYALGLILNVRFEYMRREYVQLYSAVGLGLAARFEYNRGIMTPMYDFTYFGIVVGKGFYGFAEIGAGLSGCARAGIGFRF
jgi:hypothetical protein